MIVPIFFVANLLFQATLSTSLIGDPIDDAKAQVKKNKQEIDKLYDESTAIIDDISERYKNTTALTTVADEKVEEFEKNYRNEVEDIDKDYHEKFGNFTDQDKICISIKDISFRTTKKAALNDIVITVNNETNFELELETKAFSDLKIPLASLTYENNAIIRNCTDPSVKDVEKCLTEKLAKVKKAIEDLTDLSDSIKEDLKKHSNADEVLAKEIDYILQTADGDFKKAVDKYSACLTNHPHSTTTSNPSNMGKFTVEPKGPENNNGSSPGNQGTFVIQPN